MVAEFIHPAALLQIHQQRSAGVAHVTAMEAAIGQLPEQPGFDSPEAEIVRGRCSGCFGLMVQHPTDLAGAEIGVQQQAGALAPVFCQSGIGPGFADVCRAPVLPHQGGTTGATAAAAPEHRCFALVRDSAAHHCGSLHIAQLTVKLAHGLALAGPDRLGILLNPTVRGVVDR